MKKKKTEKKETYVNKRHALIGAALAPSRVKLCELLLDT